MPNAQSPIPNAQSPMPNPQSPIPNPQYPIPNIFVFLVAVIAKVKGKRESFLPFSSLASCE
ncbi:hypothetical protein IQ276_033760 [Desmonostoc muscorum LEGE 12446]|uniref:hypothetical protein n=1 Tax=Desmonostoc muscorum TaxID=1179 RepID=UPI001F2C4ECF|nr:hypothetical protein [Desmonostoc muscorum]MCF2151297.1 hypothetical protein [Desmonostoc muscorum LEGE 12446]